MKKTICVAAAAVTMMFAGSSAQAGLLDRMLNGGCDSGCDVDLCDTSGCEMLCDSGCDGIGGGCPLLGGFQLRHSDHCFDDFISPMSNFVHFEDPRTLTELRPIFLHHRLPNDIGLGQGAIDGGEVQLLAVQARVALTERLSFIAVKDGYLWAQNEGPISGLLNDGWADVTAGFKYNYLRDVASGRLATAGMTYEIPLGSDEALQSVGDGEFHFFNSFGQRFLDGDAHYMTTLGWRVPIENDIQTESLHWSNHFDVRVTSDWYLFTDIVWWHWLNDGDTNNPGTLPLNAAGQDIFNLPTNSVVGNNLVTQMVGVKYKPSRNYEFGFGYEFPLTEYNDVLDDRWQVDLIFRY
jgi:hypothetical protein